MIKSSIQQEDIISVNVYAHNREASKHIKQIFSNLKREVDSSAIIIMRDLISHLH